MPQGALLLVLFQTSHALEHKLSHKAQGNLQVRGVQWGTEAANREHGIISRTSRCLQYIMNVQVQHIHRGSLVAPHPPTHPPTGSLA